MKPLVGVSLCLFIYGVGVAGLSANWHAPKRESLYWLGMLLFVSVALGISILTLSDKWGD
jgi:hypothetical protein